MIKSFTNEYNVTKNLLIFFILTLFSYFVLYQSLLSPLSIEDDHLYISISSRNNNSLIDNYYQFISFQKAIFVFGRFQPLFITIIFLKAKIFGGNPFLNHLEIFLIGISCSYLIWAIGKKLGFSDLNSFFSSLVFLTGYSFSEIFWRLNAAENHGLFFLLLGLYQIVKFQIYGQDKFFVWAIFFSFLAALIKESFVIIFPLVFSYPLLYLKEKEYFSFINKYRKNYITVLVLFGVLVLCIFVVIFFKGKVFGYGQPLSIPKTIQNNFIWISKWFLPYLIIPVFVLIYTTINKELHKLLPFLLFSLLFIAAHLLLYYKTIISFSQGRYLIPVALVYIFILMVAINYLEQKLPALKLYVFSFLILVLVRNGKITYINSNEYCARAQAYNFLIDEIITERPKKIAVYGGFEFFESISTNLKKFNYSPNLTITPIIPVKNQKKSQYDNSEFENSLQESLKEKYEYKTIQELKNDSSVGFLVTANYEEWEELNYSEISKSFPHHKKVTAYFTNATFSDVLKKDFWTGNLKNDQRTLVIFYK